MSWRGIVWYSVLYAAGYLAHSEPAQLSFTFRAPSALVLACGRPLRSNRLEFSPMVLQLAGLTGLTVLLIRHFGLLDQVVSLWILVGLQLACLLGVLIPLVGNIARGVE